MTDSAQQFPQRIRFATTPEIEVGTYANFAGIWHQPDCFILDFAVFTTPPQLVEDESGEKFVDLPARIVSRVRIPPEQVFEMMKALNAQLEAWERETGRHRPDPDS